MLSCDGELKADEYWMSAETSWFRDVARGQRDMWWATSVQVACHVICILLSADCC